VCYDIYNKIVKKMNEKGTVTNKIVKKGKEIEEEK